MKGGIIFQYLWKESGDENGSGDKNNDIRDKNDDWEEQAVVQWRN